MESLLAHHQFVKSNAANRCITGLEISKQRWVTGTITTHPDIVAIPNLNGVLVFDSNTRVLATSDLPSHLPWAVLNPGSITDIKHIVRFANQHHLRIAGRGSLHDSPSVFGQPQASAGIVINMSCLSTVEDIEPDDEEIWVDAGACWRDVLAKTVPAGKSPPVTPVSLGLSVGGSLSLGGIGGQSHRAGFAVDHVRALEVITGNGDRVRCSATEQPFLFSSVLGGLGQFGIIVRVCLALREIVPRVRAYTFTYDSIEQLMADKLCLIDDARFHSVLALIQPASNAIGWQYQLEAATYGQPDDQPTQSPGSDPRLAKLRVAPENVSYQDSRYLSFADRFDARMAALTDHRDGPSMHPQLSLIVPADEIDEFIADLCVRRPTRDASLRGISIHAIRTSGTPSRYPVVPTGKLNFVVSIRRDVPHRCPKQAKDSLVENRRLFEHVRSRGGTFYPTDALLLDPADWRAHFGRPLGWVLFGVAKRMFDHRFVLTPGQNIFVAPNAC